MCCFSAPDREEEDGETGSRWAAVAVVGIVAMLLLLLPSATLFLPLLCVVVVAPHLRSTRSTSSCTRVRCNAACHSCHDVASTADDDDDDAPPPSSREEEVEVVYSTWTRLKRVDHTRRNSLSN